MQFESFTAFLAMGKYGFYVWLSFGVSAALILALIVISLNQHKQVLKNIAIRQQREDKLRQLRQQQRKNSLNSTQEVSHESTS